MQKKEMRQQFIKVLETLKNIREAINKGDREEIDRICQIAEESNILKRMLEQGYKIDLLNIPQKYNTEIIILIMCEKNTHLDDQLFHHWKDFCSKLKKSDYEFERKVGRKMERDDISYFKEMIFERN